MQPPAASYLSTAFRNYRNVCQKPQRHRDTEAERHAIKEFLAARAALPLCLCASVVSNVCDRICENLYLGMAIRRPKSNDHYRPRFSLTPTMARRGSVKTVGRPKFLLDRSGVCNSSSAVSLSTLSTSTRSSMRADSRDTIVFDRHKSSNDCDDSRRDPRGSSSMRRSPCGNDTNVVAAQGLPLKFWKLAAIARPVHGTSALPIIRNT